MRSRLWPAYRAFLYPLLQYGKAVKMADEVAHLPAAGVFESVSDRLDIQLTVKGLENIPKKGRVLIAATHPTGIPDGVAVYDAIKTRRPDMTYFANRDAMRIAPGIEDMLIPVEWREENRSPMRMRETLASAIKAFESERCVVLFPAGRIAFIDENKVQTEQPWLSSVAIFARKYKCSIVPARIDSRNSWLYYWFWNLNTELRDITLFHELLNKKRKRFDITFGELIPPEALKGDAATVADALRDHALNDIANGEKWRPVTDGEQLKGLSKR